MSQGLFPFWSADMGYARQSLQERKLPGGESVEMLVAHGKVMCDETGIPVHR